jgi:membrane associated rhomboid family serine protease
MIFTLYWLSSENIFLNYRFAYFVEDNFVMVPSEIVDGQRLYTLFTSMFMHAGWFHLLGNMLYLYIFGDNIEDVFGHLGYLIFYLISGLAAAFGHILAMLYAPTISSLIGITIPSDLTSGLIGASGAISGVLGAYIVLYPRAQVLTIVLYVILPVPAILFLGFWFVMQWLYGVFDVSGGVAYFAHIGGFITGMFLALTLGLKRKKQLRTRTQL